MNVLGVIPARGGSQGIPRKNLALVANRPLLAYTCEAALYSKRLTRSILSTDDEEIARVGRQCGIEVPFFRPTALARDETPMVDVLRHAVSWLAEQEGYSADLVVLLQPTSPLRRAEHIDAAIDLLIENGADSVVSVVEVPHQFNPVSVMRIEDGRLLPFLPGRTIPCRQDKPRVYARNGPAVLAVRRDVLETKASLYGDDCRPYVMDAKVSLDIDAPSDLELAALLLTCRQVRVTANYPERYERP